MIEGLVSVITPMYNAEKWIEKTIRSVQIQEYQNWEMIIVDDCSTDQGPGIVKRIQCEDERVKYYRNEMNCGVAATRNIAICYASGQYIAFLDSDDLWYPEKLKRQIDKMQREQIAFCYSACEVIDGEGKKKNVRYVPEKVSYEKLLKGNVIPCLTVVLDRNYIPEIQIPRIHHEDYAAWLKILKNGITAYGLNEVLASYREAGISVSSDKFQAMKWTWCIYRRFLGLNLLKSSYCFCFYAVNALKKRKE